MDRTRRIIAATGLLALAVGACSSPAAPSWKFAAAETGSAQPAASAPPPRPARDAGRHQHRGVRPRVHADRRAGRGRGHVPGHVRQHRAHAARRDVRGRDDPHRGGGQDRDRERHRPGGGSRVHLLHPGARGRGHEGPGHRRRRHGHGDARRERRHGRGPGAASAPVADPNAPAYTLFDPKAPALLEGTVHDIDLPIIEKDITVAEGFVVHAWTFGGTVPGPTIRVHLGDTVNVHLTNQGLMSHSIDFHASQTAMNHQMVEIKPGETFTYTFTADYAGVWMYHCGTAPALHHIANGMFGMVIVEPKGGLPKVDDEFAFVQSEWYLGAQGEPASYEKANQTAASPDFVVFNGVANQYKDNPVPVEDRWAGPGLRPRRRAVRRQLVPRRGHDLRPGHQGGRQPPPRQHRWLGLTGRGPLPRPGRDHRVHPDRGRDVPLRHPRVQPR